MNYKWKFSFCTTLLFIAILLSCHAIGNKNAPYSGKVQIKDKAVQFEHVYAWVEPDSFHKEEWDLVLLLTENNQVNPQNQTSKPSPIALKLNYSLTSPDTVGGGAQIFLEGEMTAITSTTDKIVLTSCSSNRIEGRAHHIGKSESWDFTFVAPLLWKTGVQPFKTCYLGKQLPSDGGAPGKAFREYRGALRSGSLDSAQKAATEGFGKFLNSKYMTESISELKTRIPSGFDIVTGFSDEKTATLFVKNSGSQTIEENGVVKLVTIGQEWKVSADLFTNYVHDDLLARVMSMPDVEEDLDKLSPEELNAKMQMAVMLEETDTIRKLAKKGIDINPFLLNAATLSRETSVKTLLELGADVNFTDEDGTSPLIALFLQPKEGTRKILDQLLAAGAKVNYKPKNSNTALMSAVYSAVEFKNQAARECIQPLLAAGADPNVKGDFGDNAIRIAVRKGDVEVINLLLKGANRQIPDEDNPIRYAVENIHDEETLLPVVDALLKLGWNPNVHVGTFGDPLLLDAVMDSNVKLVTMLAKAGADLEIQNESKETALIIAVKNSNLEMVRALIDAGANINVKTWNGESLITFAKGYASDETFALLQDAGARQ